MTILKEGKMKSKTKKKNTTPKPMASPPTPATPRQTSLKIKIDNS